MAMSTGNRGSSMSEINVTPLVDVMLVLLVIFMATAPLIKQGVPVDLPKTQASAIQGDESKQVLTLTQDKRIYLSTDEETPIALAELEVKLKSNAKIQETKELYLHADRKLSYGFVVDVMATIRRAGVEKLGMVTDPLSQQKPKRRRKR